MASVVGAVVGKTVLGGILGGGAAAAGAKVLTLSKILSAGSALMAIGQGIAANNQAKAGAAFARAEAEEEDAAGATEAASLSREYAVLRGEQDVAMISNGVELGAGTQGDIAEATREHAERNIDITKRNARRRSDAARRRSRGLLAEGRAALYRGIGSAGNIALGAYRTTE